MYIYICPFLIGSYFFIRYILCIHYFVNFSLKEISFTYIFFKARLISVLIFNRMHIAHQKSLLNKFLGSNADTYLALCL